MPDNARNAGSAGNAALEGVTPLPRWSEEQTAFTDNPRVADAHKAALRSLERAVGHSADPTPDDEAREAVTAMLSRGRVLVLTGAGVSTDSGIPDYRGPQGSLRRTRPMTVQEFRADPAARKRYWARAFIGHRLMNQARPNLGHRVVAEWQRRGLLSGIVTQNVDGLHQAAGSDGVIDLHGRLDRVICLQCENLFDRQWVQDELQALNPDFADQLGVPAEMLETAPDGDVAVDDTQDFTVLPCPVCGGDLKPDVVFFGESVPAQRNREAHALAARGRGLVVLGSSLAVLSGLRFVKNAFKEDKPIVVVTDGPTRGDELVTYRSVSRVKDFLPLW